MLSFYLDRAEGSTSARVVGLRGLARQPDKAEPQWAGPISGHTAGLKTLQLSKAFEPSCALDIA